jgi:hypothetical protein
LRLLHAGDGWVCVTKEFSMAMQRGRALAHTTRLVSGVALVAMFGLWSPGRADGPADNLPDNVRPIPPVGIELDDSVRQRLLSGAEAIVRDVEAVAAFAAALGKADDAARYSALAASTAAVFHAQLFNGSYYEDGFPVSQLAALDLGSAPPANAARQLRSARTARCVGASSSGSRARTIRTSSQRI